jgi:hypothetical protein
MTERVWGRSTMTKVTTKDATSASAPESGFSLANSPQCLAARAGTEMLIGRTGRTEKEGVAPRPITWRTARFLENFGWALAYAMAITRRNWCRIGHDSDLDFDHRQGRLDGSCLGSGRGKSRSLPLAMALGLLSSAFLAVDGGSISLTGMPGPPVRRSFLTSWAAITSLGPRWQEPAFAAFKEAPTAARVPTAKAAWLTRRQRAGTLNRAHGRACSRAVRRREGGTSRRYFAPTTWTPLVQAPAADTCQLTCSISHVREDARA